MLTLLAAQATKSVPATSPDDAIAALASNATGETYIIAEFVLKIVNWILGLFGLQHDTALETWIYGGVVFGISLVVGYVAKWIILGIVRAVGHHWKGDIYQQLTGQHFFTKLSRMIPALFFLLMIQFTLVVTKTHIATLLTKITWLYVIYVTGIALSALVGAIWAHINSQRNTKHLPLTGLAQLVRGIIWIIGAIIAIAIMVDKSPASLLAGLGAFAAVLMLIFKDSILGLVAGVQLSEDDSLHVGDWIKVSGTDANGIVTDVNLTSVKVQNWDLTTTSLPPYSLISGSFTNYRSMSITNTRRICRSYMIDADSVKATTPALLDKVRKVPYMDEFITRKLAQKAAGKIEDVNNSEGLPDGTIDTNLGLFRAYMKYYLLNNPNIDRSSTMFVSTLAQTATGIPFQIYCFTATSQWLPYEAIQDSVFEHLAVMLQYFDLYTFENPSGRDTIVEGYLPNHAPETIVGIPVPFTQAPEDSKPAATAASPENADRQQ